LGRINLGATFDDRDHNARPSLINTRQPAANLLQVALQPGDKENWVT
jgi:hypothetical protein